MRIISGIAKGRRLVAPDGMQTRPTQDKTREALFSMIQAYVPNACVLDLFGGTGALALEAMSRGASKAVICDISRPAQKAIETNIKAVLGEMDTVALTTALRSSSWTAKASTWCSSIPPMPTKPLI